MKFNGTITRVQRSHDGVMVIIDTDYGPRGVELDRSLWVEILRDFDLSQNDQIVGWAVIYDPAHGDLEVIAPDDWGEDDGPAPE